LWRLPTASGVVLDSEAMENQAATLWVHGPITRMAFVLDLVKCSKMPFAGALPAPEGIIWTGIGRLNRARVVCAALHSHASVLMLGVAAKRWTMLRIWLHPSGGCRHGGSMAVRHRVSRGGGGWDNSRLCRRIAHDWGRAVVSPLIWIKVVSMHLSPVSKGIWGDVGV